MLLLMGTILMAILVVGTAALAGHPLYLIVAGVALAAGILVLARRGRRRTQDEWSHR
ncbi:MAG TPA: hypothetical protein VJT31_41015 [Rugosimonospora sp.]|nr:hypothetical protein [Rugosimonospora sp.]